MFTGVAKKEQFIAEKSTNIEQYDRDIEILGKTINVIEKHIANQVVPKFKKDKQKLYYKILQLFSVHEIHN